VIANAIDIGACRVLRILILFFMISLIFDYG
ncbi:MAG: hypothetical protein ACI8UG_000072, partial [Gammaproteobacteria bacterium]